MSIDRPFTEKALLSGTLPKKIPLNNEFPPIKGNQQPEKDLAKEKSIAKATDGSDPLKRDRVAARPGGMVDSKWEGE